MSFQPIVLKGMTLLLRIWTGLARSGHSLIQTDTGASNSVQTFAMTAAGALALSMLMAPQSMGRVAPTQGEAATSRIMKTVTGQAPTGSVASKVRFCHPTQVLTTDRLRRRSVDQRSMLL